MGLHPQNLNVWAPISQLSLCVKGNCVRRTFPLRGALGLVRTYCNMKWSQMSSRQAHSCKKKHRHTHVRTQNNAFCWRRGKWHRLETNAEEIKPASCGLEIITQTVRVGVFLSLSQMGPQPLVSPLRLPLGFSSSSPPAAPTGCPRGSLLREPTSPAR